MAQRFKFNPTTERRIMAATKSDTAVEDTIGANTIGNTDRPVSFDDLIAWIKGQEEQKADLRVHVIVSSDDNAPEFARLVYSHPRVDKGTDGYKDGEGRFTAYPG